MLRRINLYRLVGLCPVDYWTRSCARCTQKNWGVLNKDISGAVKLLLVLLVFLIITTVSHVTEDFYLYLPDKETEKERSKMTFPTSLCWHVTGQRFELILM